MVTAGTRFTTPDGAVLTIKRVEAGTIRLPSGRLVVADPGLLDTDAVPLAERVPPGKYSVEVFRLKETGETVACRVSVTSVATASWHLASLEGKRELELGDGEYYANPVETATLSIVDAEGVPAYSEGEIEAATDDMTGAAYRTICDQKTGTDLVIVPGWTDGAYPVWLGRDAHDAISCVVLDFMIPHLKTARPG